MTSTSRAFLLGMGVGAALLAFATRAIPKMSARMMQEMMSRMGGESGPAEM
jgi:hypothetical protein